jgi:hypothetical protein
VAQGVSPRIGRLRALPTPPKATLPASKVNMLYPGGVEAPLPTSTSTRQPQLLRPAPPQHSAPPWEDIPSPRTAGEAPPPPICFHLCQPSPEVVQRVALLCADLDARSDGARVGSQTPDGGCRKHACRCPWPTLGWRSPCRGTTSKGTAPKQVRSKQPPHPQCSAGLCWEAFCGTGLGCATGFGPKSPIFLRLVLA